MRHSNPSAILGGDSILGPHVSGVEKRSSSFEIPTEAAHSLMHSVGLGHYTLAGRCIEASRSEQGRICCELFERL